MSECIACRYACQRHEGAKGAGTRTKAVGVDPRLKRPSLGKRTYLVDGNTDDITYKEQESGHIVPSYERSEGFHEEPRQEPAQVPHAVSSS